jgi:hypothetical protein
VYYNICSAWIWVWGWGALGDEAGVVFDLPTACEKIPGELCANLEFWWYWRYTYPGYGYTVTYYLYPADSSLCKAGPRIGFLEGQDPVERWNHYDGLGATRNDMVALTASLDRGGGPYLATDNNVRNQQAGCAPVPTEVHSVYYGDYVTQYCPPQVWEDRLGPVNILMDATFSCGETSIEQASWGAIKKLFR